MTHLSNKGTDTAQAPRYETPTFNPSGMFARTLRGGEIARLEAQQQRNGLPGRKKLEGKKSDAAQVNGNERNTAQSPRYETSTFDPRGAFARTQRGGEIARLERQQRRNRLPDPKQLDVLVAA